MVSTRSQVGENRKERAMAGADPMALLLSLQREMADIKQRDKEEMRAIRQKNDEDLRALKQQNEQDLRALKLENEEMKRRLLGDKAERTKVITISGRSKANTLNPEREGEVSFQTGETSSLHERRHPFVDGIVNVELLPKWRGLSID